MMSKTKILLFGLGFMLVNCQYNSRPTAEALFHYAPKPFKTYDLQKPDAKYFLPYALEEISGMAYYKPGVIACVQDEEGKVFLYNHQTREIEKVTRFSGLGDYEGIATIGEHIYVTESNGNLYKFKMSNENDASKVKKYSTILHKGNNIEGLAYDNGLNKLVIACKDNAGLKGKKKKGRALFYFDLDKKEVEKNQVFSITKTKIKKFLEQHKDFEYEANRINFKPSGIALHPINDHYYIIASVGKLLLITDRKGNIKASMPLDPRLLGQPEGICFAPNGDLFISSEGQGDKGYILKFNMN